MSHTKHCTFFAFLLISTFAAASAQSSWDSSFVGNADLLYDVVMPAPSTGYAVGENGTLVKSTDGGMSWTPLASATTSRLVTLTFTDSLHGYAAGINVVRYTTNGGATWLTPQTSPTLGAKSIAFGRPEVGVAVGTAGQIARTTNAGVNWTMVVSTVGQSLYGVTFADTLNVVAVGNHRINRSTDGGVSWSQTWTPATTLFDVTSPANQVVVAVGGGGLVYRSTNCGAQWDSVVVASGAVFWAVSFFSPDSGFIVSMNGVIYKTADGGSSWDSVTVLPPGADASSIAASSSRIGMVSGARGMIYYSSTGFVDVSEPAWMPDRPELHQNYPNPFNPSTTLGFALPYRAFVTLTVFNTLGQQVATVVQGEQEAGYHEVKFDASGLASGVYLYRLQAGNFTRSRKLLLVK